MYIASNNIFDIEKILIDEDDSWSESNERLRIIENLIANKNGKIDDFLLSLFEGENKNKLKNYKNKKFLDSVVMR
ncbi:MAG: hypothetical protein OZ916_08390 [Nitrosomonas sp.]|nr:hypothetical protein [Nitrosomonas sp.]